MRNSRKEKVSQQVGGPVLNLSSGMDLENLHVINSKPDCSQSLRGDYAKTLLPEAMGRLWRVSQTLATHVVFFQPSMMKGS